MFALIAAAAVATAAPAATAAVSAAPIREVAYRVSFTRHSRLNQVGGGEAAQPSVQGADDTDEGTVTVDIMAVADNTLGVKLSELWRQRPRTQVFQGSIGPDGGLNFGSQIISEASGDLLPFFGPLITKGQTLDPGVKWTVSSKNSYLDASTTYEVKSVAQTGVTIAETLSLKAVGARGMDSSITGTIVYEPWSLAPVSGKFVRHSSRSGVSDTNVEDMIVNFNRTSDTLPPR